MDKYRMMKGYAQFLAENEFQIPQEEGPTLVLWTVTYARPGHVDELTRDVPAPSAGEAAEKVVHLIQADGYELRRVYLANKTKKNGLTGLGAIE